MLIVSDLFLVDIFTNMVSDILLMFQDTNTPIYLDKRINTFPEWKMKMKISTYLGLFIDDLEFRISHF